ncbi:LysM peptidoglycan-binding domain-containing protein [Arthrobacter oryzae]|uniref:LysM peptidoglycan-binding domain-containing protein n=1 Tax=Arthrobacter oryzae TaxID=409290 RepID=UPI00273C8EE8|nr:LysM domain-containing protein [Arthrobacter oryzae]WLQ06997.1 LysM domain-containing protein [Arthrobacter oryzae]
MDQNQLELEDRTAVPTSPEGRGATPARTKPRLRAFLVAGAVVTAVAVAAVGYSATAQTARVSDTRAVTAPAPESSQAADTPASNPATAGAAAPEPAVAAVPEPAAPAAEPAPAPPAAPAPEPAPAPEASNLYTVVAGDTVGAIAARFGVDMNAMLAANGLGVYSPIVPGQILKLTGPAVAAPAPAPAPAAAPAAPAPAPGPAAAPAPAPAPAVRTIYVAGAGGQAMVDACIGPIHFTPTDAYATFITEHDYCGGWARFSGIGVGETVSIPGYGTFTVSGRGQVPNPGTTNNVSAIFGGFPRVILQTCIPGTSQMLVIGLN